MTSATAIVSLACLVVSLSIQYLFFLPGWPSLAFLLAAVATALAGACIRAPARLEASLRGLMSPALWVTITLFYFLSLILNWAPNPIWEAVPVPMVLVIPLYALLIANYTSSSVVPPPWRFPSALVAYGIVGSITILANPSPRIDVWHYQQRACGLLLRLQNPYTAGYTNVYDAVETSQFLGEQVLAGDQIQSFPYPPLSLLMAMPGYLAGDVRWSFLFACAGASAFIVATGRRHGLAPGHPSELVAALLILHPVGLLVLKQAWTEPFLALAACASAWALSAGNDRASVMSLAAVISLKQYGLLWAAPVYATRRLDRRGIIAAFAYATLLALPFLLWSPSGFWRGLVKFHTVTPFRHDSLSIPALVANWTGYKMSPAWGFTAAFTTIFAILRSAPLPTSRTVLGGAAIFMSFFVLGKAAHPNYYWFTGKLLALAISTSLGEAAYLERSNRPAND